jgi:hypothetical protein
MDNGKATIAHQPTPANPLSQPYEPNDFDDYGPFLQESLKTLEFRRHKLPYGRWLTGDGREILFNRRYKPLWERRSGGAERATVPTPADRGEWVPGIVYQTWFYNDGTRNKIKPSVAVLELWGIADIVLSQGTPSQVMKYRRPSLAPECAAV